MITNNICIKQNFKKVSFFIRGVHNGCVCVCVRVKGGCFLCGVANNYYCILYRLVCMCACVYICWVAKVIKMENSFHYGRRRTSICEQVDEYDWLFDGLIYSSSQLKMFNSVWYFYYHPSPQPPPPPTHNYHLLRFWSTWISQSK